MVQDQNELPGWFFEVNEVSAGVYQVRGTDRTGRSIEVTGTDVDALLMECKKAAIDLESSTKQG